MKKLLGKLIGMFLGYVWEYPARILDVFVSEQFRVKRRVERHFLRKTGKFLDLENPQTLGEKIKWLMLYYKNPLLTELADKYSVRPYVAEKIGEEYLIPLIGVYESEDEIDFEKLPEKFILKATHGVGWNIICKDKKHFDLDKAKRKLKKWLNTNLYNRYFEWQYKDIKPRIICEKLLECPDGQDLHDYKIFVMNGTPKFILVVTGRATKLQKLTQSVTGRGKMAYVFFDPDWNYIPVCRAGFPNEMHANFPKPKQLEQMLALASQLAPDVPLVRVDLYIHNEQIYFGELTFTPAAGGHRWQPEEYAYIFGDMLTLPMESRK